MHILELVLALIGLLVVLACGVGICIVAMMNRAWGPPSGPPASASAGPGLQFQNSCSSVPD